VIRWALLAAALLAARPGGPYLLVTAKDAAGAALPALQMEVARALVVTGSTVLVGNRAGCDSGCVRLSILEQSPGHYLVEARELSHRSSSTFELPGSMSLLEKGRAIAVQAQLLLELQEKPAASQATRPGGRAPRPSPEPPPAPAPGPPIDAEPPAVPSELPGHAEPAPAAPPAPERRPIVVPESERTPAESPAEATSKAPALGLDVAGTLLAGRPSLVTWGLKVGARVSFEQWLELQLSVALFDDTHVEEGGQLVERRPIPIALTLSAALPSFPKLRAGLGAELVSIETDRWRGEGADALTEWSPGGLGVVEVRWPVGRFSFTGSAHAALHPLEAREELGGGALLSYPSWTFGASLGLGFRLF
jgi:hypothetical protein